MKRALLAVLAPTVLAAAVLTTAGCSGPDTPAPAASTSTPDPSAEAPAGPASEASARYDCLTGTYRLARFVGLGDKATYGTGEGGDVTVAFDDGAYTLRSDGKEPVTLTLAGQSGRLAMDGSIAGTYTGTGAALDFTVGQADGTATLSAGGQKRSVPMSEVAGVLAPSGTGTLACGDDKAIVLLSDIRLELER